MRTSELFHAYLEGSMSPEEAEQLKEILRTEEGSELFVQFMAESGTICELLNKKEIISKQTDIKSPYTSKKVKPKTSHLLLILPALAACAAICFFIFTKENSGFINTANRSAVKKGHTIKADLNETITVKSNSGSINISRGGSLSVISDNSVSVSQGSFVFKMKSRNPENPFSVKLTNGVIKIIGTSFKIEDSEKASSVSVNEGKVELTDNFGKRHILTAGQSRTARHQTDLSSSLEAYYTFESGEKDSSGNSRTAIPRNNAAVKVIDNNKAATFTGEAHYVLPKIHLTDSYSLSSWVKLSGQKKPFMAIIANGDKSWRLTLFSNTFKAHFCGTGLSNEYVNSNKELIPGKWHLVTGVYNGSSLKIYIDGKLDNSIAVTGNYNQSDYQLEIGGNNEIHFRNFEGSLDGVMIYSRALSNKEVSKLFHQGRH